MKGWEKKSIYSKLLIIISCIIIISFLLISIIIPLYNIPEYKSNSFTINDTEVNDFSYILQYEPYESKSNAINALKESEYDLLILDSIIFDQPWNNNEIREIKEQGPKLKILLCYISIGEAEEYRSYWNDEWDADNDGIPDVGAPEWLDNENPEWEGNYKVKYWFEEWQQIIFGSSSSLVDVSIAQGFSGIYMDIVDGFEYFWEQ